jgi:hypothetical protein
MANAAGADEWAKLIGYLTITVVCAVIVWKAIAFLWTFDERHTAAAPSGNWWSGGTLHAVTASAWRLAPQRNKLATAADWCTKVKAARADLESTHDVEAVRPCAESLVRCVDDRAAGAAADYRVSGAVIACYHALDWDYE